jgi:hypothetical protein
MSRFAPVLDPSAILDVRDAGCASSATRRGLLLAGLWSDVGAGRDGAPDSALDLPVGARDARLIDLRQAWFGSRFECLAECDACGATIELGFEAADIRAPAAGPHAVVDVAARDRTWRVRVPTSRDLLAIEALGSVADAQAALLDRCCVDEPSASVAPDTCLAIAAALAEIDPQAEVLIGTGCPACGAQAVLPFDIVGHLWSELDHWAEAMLDDVHVLASAYGWSERDALALTPARRAAYIARATYPPGVQP